MGYSYKILEGDVLERLAELPPQSVQTCITSPPYWGLRDYGHDGQIGLEATPELFVAKMVEVFAEVRRVLRDDGTLWMNLGDSYSGSTMTGGNNGYNAQGGQDGFKMSRQFNKPKQQTGLKPKDLCGIPWRVALALQADGWYLRSDIIWSKPNPMPESVTDRPTKAHEYLFLLTKQPRYFYDADAVREAHKDSNVADGVYQGAGGINKPGWQPNTQGWAKDAEGGGLPMSNRQYNPAGRNLRTVWSIPTQPYAEAHFATFPEKLVEPCVKAGTSEKGCCPQCGAGWVRVVEKGVSTGQDGKYDASDVTLRNDALRHSGRVGERLATTTGWKPGCECFARCSYCVNGREGDPDGPTCEMCDGNGWMVIHCTVLDPFSGSGTTGVVACKHGRDYIGIEINPEYATLSRKRIGMATRPTTYRDMESLEPAPLFDGIIR